MKGCERPVQNHVITIIIRWIMRQYGKFLRFYNIIVNNRHPWLNIILEGLIGKFLEWCIWKKYFFIYVWWGMFYFYYPLFVIFIEKKANEAWLIDVNKQKRKSLNPCYVFTVNTSWLLNTPILYGYNLYIIRKYRI